MELSDRYKIASPSSSSLSSRYTPIYQSKMAEGFNPANIDPVTPSAEPIQSVVRKPEPILDSKGVPLPASTIGPAKPTVQEEPSFWNKAARAVLPKGLEDRFGLTPPTDKPLTPQEAENAKQSLFRRQRQEQNIADVTTPKEEYTPPTNVFQKFVEAKKYGGYAPNVVTGFLLPAVGTIVEQVGLGQNMPKLRAWGEKFADQMVEKEKRSASGQSMADVPGALEGGLLDPRYYDKTISQAIGFMGAIFGTSLAVTAVTKNPVAGSAAAFAVGASLEDSAAYRDLIDKGVNPDDASTAAQIYGTLSSVIENATGIRPVQGKKILEDFAVSASKNAAIKKFFKTWAQEGILEEGSQQVLQNFITKFLVKDQKLFEGFFESVIGGLVGSLPMAGGGAYIGYRKAQKEDRAERAKNLPPLPQSSVIPPVGGGTQGPPPVGPITLPGQQTEEYQKAIEPSTENIEKVFNDIDSGKIDSAYVKQYRGYGTNYTDERGAINRRNQVLKDGELFSDGSDDIFTTSDYDYALRYANGNPENVIEFEILVDKNTKVDPADLSLMFETDFKKTRIPIRNAKIAKPPEQRIEENEIAEEDRAVSGTPVPPDVLDKTKSVGDLSKEYNPKGPGHKKLATFLETLVKNGTLKQEEAPVVWGLFKDFNDATLNKVTFHDNGRLSRAAGRFAYRKNLEGEVILNDEVKGKKYPRLEMQKGLAGLFYTNSKGHLASQTLVHEFGHAGWWLVLNKEERQIVKDVFYRNRPKQRMSLFKDSTGNLKHYLKDELEFFAQSFSDYIFENKISAPEMQSILQKVGEIFWKRIKQLVNRNQPEVVDVFRPLFEKVLAGDPSTPLTEFLHKETPSFKQDLIALLKKEPEEPAQPKQTPIFTGKYGQKLTKDVPKTKEVSPRDFGEPFGDGPLDETPLDTMGKAVESLPPEIEVEPPQRVMAYERRTPAKDKVDWVDKLRTPWRVFKRLGVGQEYRALIGSYIDYLNELPKNINKITAWSKRVSKEGNVKIFQFLDGDKTVALTTEEAKVASEIKAWLAQWADRLGMDEDARISDYITHIFPIGKGGEIPEEIATMIRDKSAKSIYNPFQLRRQGAEGYIQDTWKALDAYVKRATRKANIDPALEVFNKATAHLTEVSQVDYIEKRISYLNMRPTRIEKDIDNFLKKYLGGWVGPRPTLIITTNLRKMIARAKIGGSATSFAKNLTQSVNTFSELKTRYTLKGYNDLVKFGKSGYKELQDNGVLRNSFYEDRTYNAIKKWAETADRVLFLNMEASEYMNRGAAYFGAKAKFLDGKITKKEYRLAFDEEMPDRYEPTEEKAIEYGRFVAEKTQFLFGPLETPAYMAGPLAKTTLQFQTFGLKQTEYILQMLGDREYAKFTRYMISSTLLFGTIGKAFGMAAGEAWKTFRWGYPPLVDFILKLYDEIIAGEDKYGNVLDAEDRLKSFGSSLLTNVVPGGAQIKRTFQGVQAVSEGKGRSPSGKPQYLIEQTPYNMVRGSLWGKYNLPEAQEYYEKREEKKKGKASGSDLSNRYKAI